MKVVDTNHLDLRQSPWQVHYKPVCVILVEFSLLQYMWKLATKSADFVGDTNRESQQHDLYVTYFHDLCPQLFPRGTFVESCEVGIMEFGLYMNRMWLWCAAEWWQYNIPRFNTSFDESHSSNQHVHISPASDPAWRHTAARCQQCWWCAGHFVLPSKRHYKSHTYF